MARSFQELRAKMSPERQERNQRRSEEMLKALPLEGLRNARKLTQVKLAETMGMNQASVSKLEHRTDMYISTLSHFVQAMGGELQITAVFPEGAIRITQFEEEGEPAATQRAGGGSG